MAKAKQFVSAPRIEIVLVPENGDPNASTTLFDIWPVLHVPDGSAPTTVRVDDGPFDRDDAAMKLSEMWMGIGDMFAEPQAKRP